MTVEVWFEYLVYTSFPQVEKYTNVKEVSFGRHFLNLIFKDGTAKAWESKYILCMVSKDRRIGDG